MQDAREKKKGKVSNKYFLGENTNKQLVTLKFSSHCEAGEMYNGSSKI